MILDILERSLRERSPLIPVEALWNTCEGSRLPDVDPALLTPAIARRVSEICPTAAFTAREESNRMELKLSYGECIGCARCIDVGQGAIVAAKAFPWTGVSKQRLVRRWSVNDRAEVQVISPESEEARKEICALLGRALNIRQLDSGSCNGCEAEITALTNPHYDLERFGIHFVASPKHADMLLVTGPVTRNMAEAVKLTYEAVPAPKLVVAVGACGCSGGVFAGSHAVVGPVDAVIPVDAYIPGCPPTPAMLVSGILQVLHQRNGNR
ncbi:MAG: NADH-quinone oxidoreductase subunit B family protein [Acidobacteria bacterium]|nr:NADH-quinone oxidoreductase subunit B family protein [Acidobacteriota bacterium]MCL5287928.1 NADH-quinone oxidoreductase subunit B family protein [Acidobacteriota bacterium]